MKSLITWVRCWFAIGVVVLVDWRMCAAEGDILARLVWVKEPVQVLRAGASTPDMVSTNVLPLALKDGDQVRVLEHGRASVSLADGGVIQLREVSAFRAGREADRGIVELLRGVMSFFHRGDPGKVEVRGNGVSALVLGTEFTFAARDDGSTELALFDGEVELTNSIGGIRMGSGEIAQAEVGAKPRRTGVLAAEGGVIQWLIYYPGVLAPAEIWPGEIPAELAGAFARYGEGDLPGALRALPGGFRPRDDRERVFRAALLLGSGDLEEAEATLVEVTEPEAVRLAKVLRRLSEAVRSKAVAEPDGPDESGLASEWLVQSYAAQARRDLPGALAAARNAVARQPEFGFAWTRVAELEFSFGRVRAAGIALTQALRFSPANAQAVALHGFVLAAEHRTAAAESEFDRAIRLDPALGNAWLGRGLTRIRQGHLDDGRADLLQAAAVEPNRSLLRSYLGKAFAAGSEPIRAAHELALARKLDPNDPTTWLYGALLHQQGGEVNDAVRAYAEAEARNGARALYRSGLLLDQDRAVVNANRAAAYRDAGLGDFAVREAARALSFDPANAPAHLFLAESYLMSDRVNLRYETPRVAEYLQANLLAPVGGGVLSANLSQQDYARLFERDGMHLFSQTAYRSRGAWEQVGGMFGTEGRISYLADAVYTTDPGFVRNADFEQTTFDAQIKAQISGRDSLYVQLLHSSADAGDLASYTDPMNTHPTVRVRETLEPLLVAGWHRAWSPEHHTLFLAGLIQSDQRLANPDFEQGLVSFNLDANGMINGAFPISAPQEMRQEYRSLERWFTGEAQHLWHTDFHTLVTGFRYQHGEITARNDLLDLPPEFLPFSPEVTSTGERFQGYTYATVRPVDSLALTAGLSLDSLEQPRNLRVGPLAEDSIRTAQASPKAGFVWAIRTNVWLRGAYTRSLGGVSYEQSIRLEPTLVGGFNQAFRSLVPESLTGTLSGARNETWQVALEARPTPNTLFALQAEHLGTVVDSWQGVFFGFPLFGVEAMQTPVRFAYHERALTLSAAQLLGREWSVFARYRLAVVELDRNWLQTDASVPGAPPNVGTRVRSAVELHTATFGLRYNSSLGWFAGADAVGLFQSAGDPGDYDSAPGERVWQVGAFGGYRFCQRRAEVMVGIENILDQDYRLHPLGGLGPLPRERTGVVRLKWVW